MYRPNVQWGRDSYTDQIQQPVVSLVISLITDN